MTGIFESILNWIYNLIGSYGWSVVLFTLLVRLVLLPLDIKSRKGMRAMSKVQPKVVELQKKYANDRDKLNQKTMELYKKEKVSPTSGCLPLILQMVVLFIMFGAMRNIATEKTGEMLFGLMNSIIDNNGIEGLEKIAAMEPFLWIKNIFQPDSIGAPILPNYEAAIAAIEAAGKQIVVPEGFDLGLAYETYRGTVYGTGQFTFIRVLFFNITFPNSWEALVNYANGLFILPVFAAVSQIFMTKISAAQQGDAAQQANSMNSGFMKWFFPIFSLYICAGYNAAFAVYWGMANIIAIVQQFLLNVYFNHKDKLEAAKEAEAGEKI